MAKPKVRRRLKDIQVDEISFVDRPAVPGAKFVISKRKAEADIAEDEETEDDEEEEMEEEEKVAPKEESSVGEESAKAEGEEEEEEDEYPEPQEKDYHPAVKAAIRALERDEETLPDDGKQALKLLRALDDGYAEPSKALEQLEKQIDEKLKNHGEALIRELGKLLDERLTKQEPVKSLELPQEDPEINRMLESVAESMQKVTSRVASVQQDVQSFKESVDLALGHVT